MRLGLRFHWVGRSQSSARPCRQSRTSLSWLVTRGLRIGAINYHVQRKATPTRLVAGQADLKLLAALPLSLVYAVQAVLDRAQGDHRHASDDGGDRQRAGRDRHRAATLQSLEDRIVSQLRHHFGSPRRRRRDPAAAGDGYRSRRHLRRRAAAGLDFAASVRRSRQHADRRCHAPATSCRPMRRSAALAVLTHRARRCATTCAGSATLLSPAFVLFAAWLCVTVVLSFDPAPRSGASALTACVHRGRPRRCRCWRNRSTS